MSQESQNIQSWRLRAKQKGATHFLDVLDSFDYTHYPVFVMPNEKLDEIKAKYSGNMQSVYGTYEVKDEK